MSKASERAAWREALAGYSLMSLPEVARFLNVAEKVVRGMVRGRVLPSVTVGGREKVDPLDLAVHVLAEREGVTAEQYWDRHGEATPEHARRMYARIRKLQAA